MLSVMRKNGLAVLAVSLTTLLGSAGAQALECNTKYTIVGGDSLSRIAARAYKKPSKWPVIYYENQDTIGKNANFILVGQVIKIPCLDETGTKAATTTASAGGAASDSGATRTKSGKTKSGDAKIASLGGELKGTTARSKSRIQFLTADDYRPFTDRALPGGGMITNIIGSAMKTVRKEANGPRYAISWVNDWGSHLNPLLARRAFDMGFPWFRPPCDQFDKLDKPAQFRCKTFHFSSPVFEILVLFFKKRGSDFKFDNDNDVIGKRLCRPEGYFTFDLDKGGRNWVRERKVALVRPRSVNECFKLLTEGKVDAVALNEFTGRGAVNKLKMNDVVERLPRPISVESLHVVIAKSHPKARIFMYYFNNGLARIRANGTYDKIVEGHLTRFWSKQESG